MRLLVDYHHACLFESHQLTFGDRFGWDVLAPYGMEWFDSWFWSFEREHHGDAVARQYLEGIFVGGSERDGIIEVADRKHPGRTIRGITLERARSERWDVALSTVPSNAAGFRKFASETGAIWGIHVGNQWGDEAWVHDPAFAILTTTSPVPPSVPHVIVHQEFSLEDFRYEPPVGYGPARSFISCFPEMESEYANFTGIASAYPDNGWEVFASYGTAPLDQYAARNIDNDPEEGDAMRGAGVIWHAKHWSDGFGHVIHRAFAVGRPVFGYDRYYSDKLAGPLWIDGVTSFDVERHDRSEVIGFLKQLRAEPERYREMCEASARRFREVVSFDEDAQKLQDLMSSVIGVAA